MLFLYIFLAIIFIIATAFLTTPKGRGWIGETRVKFVIGKTKPGIRCVLNDCKMRVTEDKTTQIDHILVNERGVFVIETKNYTGRIYGHENQFS